MNNNLLYNNIFYMNVTSVYLFALLHINTFYIVMLLILN